MHIKSIVSVLLSGKSMLKCQLEYEIKYYLRAWLVTVKHGSSVCVCGTEISPCTGISEWRKQSSFLLQWNLNYTSV